MTSDPVSAWMEAFREGDREERMTVLAGILGRNVRSPDVDALVAGALGGTDPRLLRRALAVVDQAGILNEKIADRVIELLDHQDPGVRESACEAACRLRSRAREVLPVLARRLADGGWTARRAVAALSAMGPEAVCASDALEAALERFGEPGTEEHDPEFASLATALREHLQEKYPVLSIEACRDIYREAEDRFSLAPEVLLENAGREMGEATVEMIRSGGPGGCVEWAEALQRREAGDDGFGIPVAVVCGPGKTGTVGLVAARRLYEEGFRVTAFVTERADRIRNRSDLSEHSVKILEEADLDVKPTSRLLDEDLAPRLFRVLIDALFGTGLRGEVKDPYRALIEQINAAASEEHTIVVAADVPSGMNGDTGMVNGAALRADRTVSFAGIKEGLTTERARSRRGELRCASLGIPRSLLMSHTGS